MMNRDVEIGSILRRLVELETREDASSVTDTGWLDLTYNTGWGDFGTGAGEYYGAQYRRVNDIVYMRGLVKRTSGSSYTIGTLPSGFRPLKRPLYPSNQGGAFGRVDIEDDGQVIANSGGGVTYVALDGIWFSTI